MAIGLVSDSSVHAGGEDGFLAQRPQTLSALVAELAQGRGVCERTVWRWVARVRGGGSLPAAVRRCARCGRLLPPRATVRRRFCGDSCRARFHETGALTGAEGASMVGETRGQHEDGEEQRRRRQVLLLVEFVEALLEEAEGRAPPPASERERRVGRLAIRAVALLPQRRLRARDGIHRDGGAGSAIDAALRLWRASAGRNPRHKRGG